MEISDIVVALLGAVATLVIYLSTFGVWLWDYDEDTFDEP